MKLALLSDIHSNFIALEACLEHVRGERFDRICMLGDIIAYGPRPKECVETVRALQAAGALCLKGNHDENSVRQGVPGGVTEDRYQSAGGITSSYRHTRSAQPGRGIQATNHGAHMPTP